MKCKKEKSLKNVWFKKTEQVNKITIKKNNLCRKKCLDIQQRISQAELIV